MGRKKVVTLYNGRYRGSFLTEEACDRLDMIRQIKKELALGRIYRSGNKLGV